MKTFYYNGTIITMREPALYAEAVCVENGRIQAVGTLDDVMQYKTDGDEMVDLQGKTMLPGFLDAHSHFVGAANAGADAAYRGSAENVCELWRDYGSGWNGRKTVV